MEVRVRLFAALRERAGTGELRLELPEGATVAEALTAVDHLSGGLALVMAVNREYAEPGQVLTADDELALVPPVSGGAGGPEALPAPHVHAAVLGDEALSLDRVLAEVQHPGAGAIVTFSGVTRDVDHLDYDGYAEMARPLLEQLALRAAEEHGLLCAAVEHRLGRVHNGQASVVVAASAAHRAEAFAGARAIIDAVKEQAPLWKREDGAWKHEHRPGPPA